MGSNPIGDTNAQYRERFYLQPLLIGDEGSGRHIFGSTHQALAAGAQDHPAFEILALEDLLSWLQDPAVEEARQKLKYKE